MEMDLKKILRLECLGIALALIVFSIFDFYPKLKEAGRLKKQIRSARTAVKAISQTEKEKQKKGLEEELSRKKEDLRLLQQAVLDIQAKVIQEENIPLVTQKLVGIAASSRIELASIKPLALRKEGEYELLPMEVQFQCEYAGLIRFLSEIEASSTLAAVMDLSIKKEELIYPKLDIRLAAYALFVSEKKAAGPDLGKK